MVVRPELRQGKEETPIYAVPAANKKAMKCYHDTLVTEADTPEDDTTTKVMCRTTQPFTTKFETKTYGPNKDKYTHWVTLTRAGPAGLTPQIAEATQQQSSEDLIEMVAAATTLSYNNLLWWRTIPHCGWGCQTQHQFGVRHRCDRRSHRRDNRCPF